MRESRLPGSPWPRGTSSRNLGPNPIAHLCKPFRLFVPTTNIASLDAGRLAQGGDVVEREEVGVVGQPAHPEYHHQDDQHLHDLESGGRRGESGESGEIQIQERRASFSSFPLKQETKF